MVIESELKNVKITLAQTAALHRVFNRNPLYLHSSGMTHAHPETVNQEQLTFDDFIKLTGIGSYDCVMVPWNGMWLGIETDGHTHS
ncbi:hypothetical protein [Rhizobium phage RHph_X2_28B]|uniref:hypothetical protein n=1 Tax=Rhizobium phage RHph_X2_28B TaxID=2836086 RepID=UPI00232987F8|nr:hypothetical protein PP751_gp038 [Rhizobium phage RHph_X2_28B]QWY83490.1 hypothetical protein [Rhizobium phage RHph_X2_28B]QWY83726.1 hypothetical protein [Rhizobium phage RHph_X3_15]